DLDLVDARSERRVALRYAGNRIVRLAIDRQRERASAARRAAPSFASSSGPGAPGATAAVVAAGESERREDQRGKEMRAHLTPLARLRVRGRRKLNGRPVMLRLRSLVAQLGDAVLQPPIQNHSRSHQKPHQDPAAQGPTSIRAPLQTEALA